MYLFFVFCFFMNYFIVSIPHVNIHPYTILRLPWWFSGKESACQCRRWQVPHLGQENTLEKGMATHSNILAWKIPWTEEPGGLQSKQWQRVGLDSTTKHRAQHYFTCFFKKFEILIAFVIKMIFTC